MSTLKPEHEPVLVAEILRHLDPQPGQTVLDGTVGLGGHAIAIAPKLAPGGRYVGLDVDPQMVAFARENLGQMPEVVVDLERASYADAANVLRERGLAQVDHVLVDLGVNSAQLADAERGFSFDRDGPLDMRYDPTRKGGQPASELVNGLSEAELADIFYHYGQEGASRRVAKRICEFRRDSRIMTTQRLAQAVTTALGTTGGKTHPATRVFQALRIAVNGELDNLEQFLEQITDLVRPGGRVAVIAFHSIEDGIVKRFLRAAKAGGTWVELTKRPVIAEGAERKRNPRSRSAKLRVAERTNQAS